MSFKRMQKRQYPRRQWSIVSYPGDGKSTLAAQMTGPILTIDADQRFDEVLPIAQGEVYQLSDSPADNIDARRIAALLKQNMPGSDVRTIVVDSVTAILTPLVTEAIQANDAGENKNRIASFKGKALAMRTLQDAITGYGTDVLWIYHYRDGMDSQANKTTSTSISTVELARLRRSLNMQLSIVRDGNRRGIKIDWCRRGRSGGVLWDDSGCWAGMSEKVEQMAYDGLSEAEADEIEHGVPARFTGPGDAIAWAMGLDPAIFADEVHAQNSLRKAKEELLQRNPGAKSAQMWAYWIERCQAKQAGVEID